MSEQNCHPFQWGRYMWMHNGMVSLCLAHKFTSDPQKLLSMSRVRDVFGD